MPAPRDWQGLPRALRGEDGGAGGLGLAAECAETEWSCLPWLQLVAYVRPVPPSTPRPVVTGRAGVAVIIQIIFEYVTQGECWQPPHDPLAPWQEV